MKVKKDITVAFNSDVYGKEFFTAPTIETAHKTFKRLAEQCRINTAKDGIEREVSLVFSYRRVK